MTDAEPDYATSSELASYKRLLKEIKERRAEAWKRINEELSETHPELHSLLQEVLHEHLELQQVMTRLERWAFHNKKSGEHRFRLTETLGPEDPDLPVLLTVASAYESFGNQLETRIARSLITARADSLRWKKLLDVPKETSND
ncbi:hypothetical protein [Nesterenkonia rhizosphaerae]|uniref:Uncharacterized protein n=1 Tax=Nesterenkonia rhizosphaerae TaxID=1348272 RepID=A0ABP9FZB0_9MICC